jgi:hypothetical protein
VLQAIPKDVGGQFGFRNFLSCWSCTKGTPLFPRPGKRTMLFRNTGPAARTFDDQSAVSVTVQGRSVSGVANDSLYGKHGENGPGRENGHT